MKTKSTSANKQQNIFSAFVYLSIIILFAMNTNAQSESKNVPKEWQTLAEQTNYKKSWNYDDTISYAQRLAKTSEFIDYESIGRSGEGREIALLIAAGNKEFTPEKAKESGKAVIFIQAGIHSGEIDGKDAGFALLRDSAITKTLPDLLNNSIILFVPIYNVDGHELSSPFNRINQNGPDEMGFRATSTNLNLNRDYIKADAPETRAWLKFWNKWKPDFFIDCHVTDGAEFQYSLTYEYAHFQEVSPALKHWMNQHFDGSIVQKVEREGNLLTHYVEFAGREVTKGVATFIATPRFATGYTPLRNRAGLLIETHSYKDYRVRVRGTYDILRYTVEEINQNKQSLFDANKRAETETIERGKTYDAKRQFPLQLQITEQSEPLEFRGTEYTKEKSDVSGVEMIAYGTKPLNITIPRYDQARISVSVAPPLYYAVPPQWKQVIDIIKAHGIQFQTLKEPLTIEVESYRLSEQRFSQQPFESHNTVTYKVVSMTEKRTFPRNSIIIPLEQEAANVAIHLLEPGSQDSLLYWGFFSAIFEQKEYGEAYVLEKLARKMLAEDPALKTEFEEKLKVKTFAQNPQARLGFFYQRSPYYDRRIGLYPVGRILVKNVDGKF
jgi:hypothetical protein